MLGKRREGEISEVKSILSQGLKIEGNISSEGKIRIDGAVIGDIRGDFIIIGETSQIKGNITAKNLVVMGEVEGNISVESLEIKESAKIRGDINCKSLSVEPEASIEGHVKSGNFSSISESETTE